MEQALEAVEAAAARAMVGGSEQDRERHLGRGKLLPRDRVNRLLVPGSPFLETGLFAAHDMYGRAAPSAGMITGIGRYQRHRMHGDLQ